MCCLYPLKTCLWQTLVFLKVQTRVYSHPKMNTRLSVKCPWQGLLSQETPRIALGTLTWRHHPFPDPTCRKLPVQQYRSGRLGRSFLHLFHCKQSRVPSSPYCTSIPDVLVRILIIVIIAITVVLALAYY